MLLANQAVKDRLQNVKSQVGTTILVNPAGSRDFQGGGEPLTTGDLAKVSSLAHVASVSETLNLTATTIGSETGNFKAFGGGQKMGETSLESSIDPGTIGKRFVTRGEAGGTVQIEGNGPMQPPANFKLPIRFAGITGGQTEDGQTIKLTSGRQLSTSDKDSAVVGKSLAAKNNLKVGSTFTLYNETFTVAGIFDSGTDFGNDTFYIPLATAQRVSEAGNEISSAAVKADSVDNLTNLAAKVKSTIGSDKADVTTTEQNAMTAVESLRTVERVSLIGFIIALAAAAVIIFLTMLMIVRERRREIGVLKAIGGSNRSIVGQFVTEALVLVLISAFVGFGFATVSGNGIAGALVRSNTGSSSSASNDGPSFSAGGGPVTVGGGPRSGGFRAIRFGGDNEKSAADIVGDVATTVDINTLAIGLGAAVLIAIVGSAVPSWLVTKVRPAEVLRGE
jgi:putative ABC transport system permease protein